jgi:hypothetical protein
MQQENIEIAARKQLAPPVAAQRDQSHPWLRAEQRREPAVGVRAPADTIRGERSKRRPVGLWTGLGG